MASHPKRDTLEENFNTFRLAVGHFVMEFGNLESAVNRAIAGLMGSRHPAKVDLALSQIINFSSRVQLLGALGAQTTRRKPHLRALQDLIDELLSVNAYRNRLVHGPWGEFHVFKLERGKPIRRVGIKTAIHPRKLKTENFSVAPQGIDVERRRAVKLARRISTVTDRVLSGYSDYLSAERRNRKRQMLQISDMKIPDHILKSSSPPYKSSVW